MSNIWLLIIIWILQLILRGYSEEEAIQAAAEHFGVSQERIREHL